MVIGNDSTPSIEVLRWVSEHGGIEAVKERIWKANELESMLCAREAKIERLKKQLGYVEDKCAERREGAKWLKKHGGIESVKRRMLPSGIEWPRYEDGRHVEIGDAVQLKIGRIIVEAIEFSRGDVQVKDAKDGDWNTSVFAMCPLRRPAPMVLGSDGKPIEAGQTVFGIGRSQHVFDVLDVDSHDGGAGGRFTVRCFDKDDSEECFCDPKMLTHEQPDSWERIENDMADCMSQQQCGPISPEIAVEHACSFVRRCMALAEKQTRCIPTENDAKRTTMKIRYTKKNGDTFIYDVKDEQITFDQWFYSCLDHCGGFFPTGCGFISKDQIAKVEVVQDAD